ncbi:uncharacterized protein N7483_009523 [Penicillium malachiteum]|uniref:uncharacterized protein n=1 Tax=Penicillium malachiteum TaxID=1324776 RepID=UPI00254942F0|nr:uncharacterized protein N7483_009523 [Penicillium malachiteum]KAJ5721589.1 hypothetical protein N7483_009523 [Penicillium malachiteum]
MSSKLWEFFIQDDVESFQRFLANATFAGPRAAGGPGGVAVAAATNLSSKTGSPGIGTSPGTSTPERPSFQRGGPALSRADVNARDHYGRTLLHHIASSPNTTAIKFATALLEIPFLDIYAQDWESGWTALHRALYAGNATIALALMARDTRDATDFSKVGQSAQSGTLIKIKDREGYSPFDVYGATITSRDIKQMVSLRPWNEAINADTAGSDVASNSGSTGAADMDGDVYVARAALKSRTDFAADEVFTLGSNKNLTLGLGDQDDRQFPERVTLKRPQHLLDRFYLEYQEEMERLGFGQSVEHANSNDLPTIVKNKPMKIQNVFMSKLHTAIVTDDPEANLYICGFGPGGRLGTGDEATRFTFACIETGGLAGKKVMSVALGQDHTLAITEFGEIFSWGSNKFGQLGYGLPRTSNKNDVPIQTTPRQIFNPFKKEMIIGAAASPIHSVVFSNSGLYTFGKNEGQLGLVDSDARSLEVQTTPRRATAVLLQSHEVWVFSQYGYSKLSFPLEATSRFIRDSFMATRYEASANRIVKITCGGNTICALASSGDVFTVEANKPESPSVLTSTTNPAKIRNSLASPVRAWSVKKSYMAASDVDVGQDGSIIICTTSGSAWRKEKRTKKKEGASKDYKFARIPGLSRAVAVRSNAFGAYSVAQRDCNVTKEQIHVNESTLWADILPLSPFLLPAFDDVDTILADASDEPVVLSSAAAIKKAILLSSDMESQFLAFRTEGTIWLTTSLSDARIPVHEFLLSGRSPVLRKALQEFRASYFSSVPDVLDVEYNKEGHIQIKLHGLDFLTVMNIAFFLYTDSILDVWHKGRTSSKNANRYRQVRTEVMRIALQLGLTTLERAARLMVEPQPSLKYDMALAINHSSFFDDADVVVELDGDAVKVHSYVVCQRCPFFDVLFNGQSGGGWLAGRRANGSDAISVDLKHINPVIFNFVLRYLYADTEEQLFDEVRAKSLDDFVDFVIDLMYVADELMIDRLSQICQKMLGRFVNIRNITYLLNSVSPIYKKEFKEAALEYICLDLESMLTNRYLDGLDDDLLSELNKVCHENQLACYPISRGRNTEAYIFEKYPEIISSVASDKRRRIDAMTLQSRLSQVESYDFRPRASVPEKSTTSPSVRKGKPSISKDVTSPTPSPMLKPRQSTGDLMFQMDDEALLSPPEGKSRVMRGPRFCESENSSYPDSPILGASISEADSLGNRSFLDQQMSSPRDPLLAQSPTESRALAMHQKRGLPSSAESSSAPWSSPVASDNKKDLRDIMEEMPQSRVSNLTLGMAGKREPSGNFTPKISQKERRKMQQQQMQEKLAEEEKAKAARENPWQMPSPAQPSTFGKVDPLPSQAGPSSRPSELLKTPQKHSMTMRQTVAGTPPPRSRPAASPVQIQGRRGSANMQQPSFSKASPSPSSTPQSPFQQTTPKPAPQPSIHSIRHIPRPDSSRSPSYGSLSLAAILEQQQIEKDEIHEAATAKHNLQDIQVEQEFQQWWDQESKRVQGLLEPEPQQRGGKAGRGGKASGGSGGPRKPRGNKNANPDGPAPQSQKQALSSAGRSTPKKNVNGPASAPSQPNTNGKQVPSGGQGKNSRRGGTAQRGKGRDRE